MMLRLAKLAMTLAIIAAGTGVSIVLAYSFDIPRISMIYLASVIIVAARFGSYYGLLAAVISVSSFDFFIENPRFTFALGTKQDLVNAIVFIAAAILTGAYADRFRQQQTTTRLLLDATKGFPSAALDPFARTLLRDASAPDELQHAFGVAAEARRIVIAISIVLVGAGLSYALHRAFGMPDHTGVLLAAIIACALFIGARAALVAAIVAVVAFNVLFEDKPFALSLGSADDFMNLAVFTAIAWWLGDYADKARAERAMSRTTLEASRGFSTIADEPVLRSALRSAICRLSGANSVWVMDETGALIDPELSGPLPQELAAARAGVSGDIAHEFQVWRIRPLEADGQDIGAVIWFAAAVPPRQAARTARAIAILIDLAIAAIARIRVQAEKAEMETIAQTERLRSAMLSSMSHDFRTPLAGVLGSATSLLELGDKHDERARRELLLNIRDQAARLNRYVENLLSLTRLDAGAVNVLARRELLEPLIYDAWEALGDAGGARRILDARIDEDAAVVVDPVLLHQALANVFENAIKFSKDGSTVRVRASRAGPNLALEIADEGPGVETEDCERIFERFYRAKGAAAPGIGLGLHITKSVLEVMGATISARARDDGAPGLVMTMTLPADEARP
jgi:K+-sensing histidine kinase KdpD